MYSQTPKIGKFPPFNGDALHLITKAMSSQFPEWKPPHSELLLEVLMQYSIFNKFLIIFNTHHVCFLT